MRTPEIALGCLLILATAGPVEAQPRPLPPSLDLALAMPAGPDARVKDASVKITEEYARLVGCEASLCYWLTENAPAWPGQPLQKPRAGGSAQRRPRRFADSRQ